MSIQGEIDRIAQNVSDTYDVLNEAGATMPAAANTDNLAATAASISAVLYGKAQSLTAEQKSQARTNIGASNFSGSYNDLTNRPSSFTPSAHNQAASTITAGTFAGQVVANSGGQTYSTSLLRNSKLVSADTTPSVNGEINWTYK